MRHGWSPWVAFAVLALTSIGCAAGSGGEGSHAGSGGSSGADGGDTDATGGGGSTGGSGGENDSGADVEDWLQDVCFLHDCDTDAECVGCPNGRNFCETTSNRCVVCLPGQGATMCDPGKICSQYGTCIPESMTCPTDSIGEPTVTCASDNDCFACDTMHQVCDVASQKCVTCSETNAFACDPTDRCKNGQCLAQCPSPCSSDQDCEECGTFATPGSACNQVTRHCGECSATTPCPNDKVCGPQGMCIAVCGAQGKPKGVCMDDADCSGCEADLVACHKPINGGDGKCGLPAEGCSDIPGNFAVLPEPWSQVTNLCSNDGDCSGVGIDLNVGKILRDLTGLGQINDATLQYGMNVCASVSVGAFGETYSCGLCVPCREDSDCEPIKFDPLVEQAFGPVGSLAAKVLFKYVFGDAPHELNMYCEPVLGEFGVCAPCIDFLHECGVSTTEGVECNNDWECAAGEHCKDNKCTAIESNCFGGEPCPAGQVCAWNGNDYCCRQPGQGTEVCASDAECLPQVCAWNGQGYYCVDKDPSCE